MHASALCSLLPLFLACSSPPVRTSDAVGEPVEVDLLDANFVLSSGVRQPWEAWIYDMRQRCRACRADEVAVPWVRFRLAGTDVPTSTVDRIQYELRASGVTRIEWEGR
ncbi:MAG: hypothetical protein KDB80_15490 [Planctomycetes bacterium]|nr:hypothetical protein [Planctomycetota bacterium]